MLESRIVPHQVRRSSGLGYAALLLVSVAVLHLDLASGTSVHHRGQDDLELTIPYAQALWRAIRAHESPWWLPWIDGGTSAFARFPYLGPFYPAVLAFAGGDPLRALDGVLLVHVALAAFGARAWIRALGGSHEAGLLGGMVLAGSSVWQVAAHEGYATEAPVWTWLPWALAAIERARGGETLRYGAGAALAVGLLALGGHATDLYVGALAATVYLIARLYALRGSPLEARRLVVATVAAGALGAGIGLAFWLPVLRTIDLSTFATERAPKPVIPHPLSRLLHPHQDWGTKDSLYVGLVTIALMASALRAETRRLAWPLASAAALVLALSLGPGTSLWRALGVLPGFAAIDQANVFSWPFALFAAVLAGLGVPCRGAPSSPRRVRAMAIAWPLLVADLVIYSLHGSTAPFEPVLGSDGQRRAPVAGPASCELAGDRSRADPTRALVIERWAPEAGLRLWRNDALRLGCIEDVRASAHLGSPRVRRVLRALGPWPVDWDTFSDDRTRAPRSIDLGEASRVTRTLDLLGVGVVATDLEVDGDAFERRAVDELVAVWTRRTPLPRYRLVTRTDFVSGEEATAERVLAPSFDPRTSVVLEEDARGLLAAAIGVPGGGVGAPQPVQIERYRPGDIRLRTQTRPGELLVVGETWFPGWRATVDGRPLALVRANYLHMALAPPAGTHTIHLAYRPPGLALGVGISCLSALLAFTLASRPRRVPSA